MNSENKYNRYTFAVMEELKKNSFFFKKNSLIQYNLFKEESSDELLRIGKVQAVWDLRDLGAITIHNEERIGVDYEFELLIIHDAFDGIYHQCLEEVEGQSLERIKPPYCDTAKGIGYLKFGKQGAKKKIGGVNTRPFKFLQATTEPFDVYKSVDAVFSAIWLEKDNNDSKLTSPNTAKVRKVEIIKNSAIKELQKGKKLGGRIRFVFNESETQVKAVLVD